MQVEEEEVEVRCRWRRCRCGAGGGGGAVQVEEDLLGGLARAGEQASRGEVPPLAGQLLLQAHPASATQGRGQGPGA